MQLQFAFPPLSYCIAISPTGIGLAEKKSSFIKYKMSF